MADYDITSILSGTISGIPIWFLLFAAVMIVFVIIILTKSRTKDVLAPPKIIEPQTEIINEFKDILSTTGSKLAYKSNLMFGLTVIGRIMSFTPFKYETAYKLKKNAVDNYELNKVRDYMISLDKKTAYVEDNFMLYKVIGKSIFHYIFYMFGNLFNIANERYFLVDVNFIIKIESANQYIDIKAQPNQFYKNIYVFSAESKHIIQGMVNDMTVKQVLKDTVNFIPQMHYHDMVTGRFSAKAREIREIKKAQWKDKGQNLEKDIQDVENE